MQKWYYTKNEEFVNHSINKTFHEIVTMSEESFRSWVIELRHEIINFWEKGNPPRLGFTENQMRSQCKALLQRNTDNLLCYDELTKTHDIIKSASTVGNFVNQFFPTMYKTKIVTSSMKSAKSIYDYFVDPNLYESQYKKCLRHFRKDGFYNYSHIVRLGEAPLYPNVMTGTQWIDRFEESRDQNCEYDYWICPVKVDKNLSKQYTGNNKKKLNKVQSFVLTKEELNRVPKSSLQIVSAMSEADKKKYNGYHIRFYKKNTKIFPLGFKSIRMSYGQYAVNFPALIAKHIYEKYSYKDKNIVWDFSAGWGGRLLGALSTKKQIHYIGNDPNPDHITSDGQTKYDKVAEFFYLNSDSKKNTYEIFSLPAETMKDVEAFKRHKGVIDIIFTSPPYFCKEIYSNDRYQSCNMYPEYNLWKTSFLMPTLNTAMEWLSPDGVIIINIADVKIGKVEIPLERDLIDIMKKAGFALVEELKLAMQLMQGSNRVQSDDESKSTFKHVCQVKNKLYKYEPILVFKRNVN